MARGRRKKNVFDFHISLWTTEWKNLLRLRQKRNKCLADREAQSVLNATKALNVTSLRIIATTTMTKKNAPS